MKTIFFVLGNINYIGGIENITKSVSSELSKDFHIVIINTLLCKNSSGDIFKKDNIECVDAFGNKRKQILSIFKYIRKYKPTNTIIQGKNLYYLTVLSLFTKCKIIFYDHDSLLAYSITQKNEYLPRKRACKYADKIFVLTNENKQAYIDLLKVKENKISVIPNFIDLPEYKGEYDVNSKTIVAVGRYHEQKRFDLLIEAFALFAENNDDWTLEIYGDGELRESLQQLINSKNLTNRVFLKGPYKSLEEAYTHKAFFVMTSEHEGFGIVLLEAMHFKLPVIAFDCHIGPSDIIEKDKNGILVININESNLLEAINELSLNKKKRIIFSNSIILSLKKYNKNKIINLWINQLNN